MRRGLVWLVLACGVVSAEGQTESPSHKTESPTITIEQYIGSLELIHALLSTNQVAAAQAEGKRISGMTVTWPRGKFAPDHSLIDAIATSTRDDYRLRERVRITIDEIRRSASLDTAPVDMKVLQQVAREQKVPELVIGGDVSTPAVDDPLSARIGESIAEVFEWIGEKLVRLAEWFLRNSGNRRLPAARTSNIRSEVIGVAALIALLLIVLAVQVLRRSRAAVGTRVESVAPIGSARDEDPLSRGANEWEVYAAQLAAAGRHREAIRAWYHAVLVTCYAAGALHFRKGKTNWEYVATLAPSVAWRPEMIELTRRFEQEWYGSDASSDEALDLCSTLAKDILESLRRRGAA